MWLSTFFVLIAKIAVIAQLRSYNETTVFRFIDDAARRNVSELCRDSLSKIEPYLSDYDTIPAQKKFFSDAFGSGDAEQFVSRDQDRWVYRAYECLQAAGEATYSKSEHPLHYCFGYNEAKEKIGAVAHGICIPSTCYDDRAQLLEQWRVQNGNDKDAIDYTSCTKSRHDRQWYQKVIPLAEFALHLTFILVAIIATIYHVRNGDQTKSTCAQVLLAFSVKKNFGRLIQMPKDPQSTITCMFGMRFLSMVWTLVGHSFIFVQAYLENVQDFKDDMVDNFYNQWITNFTLSVDTFFVLSATLTAFTWFRKMHKNTSEPEPTWTSCGYWLRYYRHRVIRLWPAYIYTLVDVGLRASVQHFHPMWPPTDPAVQCPKYWWQNVLFVNSLFSNRCMPWTWYIGTEFIFYLLSPIFLLTLRNAPKIGFALAIITITSSAALNAAGMIAWNFPPTQLLWKQPDIFSADFIQHHIVMYIKPWYRIGPYIIGLLLGYYIAGVQRLAQKVQRSPHFCVIGWSLASLAGFWAIFGLYPALQGWNWPLYHLVYGAIHRTVFALAIAWLIYACHTGIGGVVNSILSMKPLLPLSSLCYSVYLVHMVLVVFTYLLVPFPMVYHNKLPIFGHCLAQLALSYVFGTFCAMLSELPALNLERILFQGERKATLQPVNAKDCEMQLKPVDSK
uniref:Acyltransferase 3 domain-containing protein n=2 Tax=Ascaris TaxID=6251 RepID=A0A9J2P0Z0_ASCLU